MKLIISVIKLKSLTQWIFICFVVCSPIDFLDPQIILSYQVQFNVYFCLHTESPADAAGWLLIYRLWTSQTTHLLATLQRNFNSDLFQLAMNQSVVQISQLKATLIFGASDANNDANHLRYEWRR